MEAESLGKCGVVGLDCRCIRGVLRCELVINARTGFSTDRYNCLDMGRDLLRSRSECSGICVTWQCWSEQPSSCFSVTYIKASKVPKRKPSQPHMNNTPCDHLHFSTSPLKQIAAHPSPNPFHCVHPSRFRTLPHAPKRREW